jgi:hypothetical protein
MSRLFRRRAPRVEVMTEDETRIHLEAGRLRMRRARGGCSRTSRRRSTEARAPGSPRTALAGTRQSAPGVVSRASHAYPSAVTLPTLRSQVLALLALSVVTGCALFKPVPGQQLDLPGTTWTVASIDGTRLSGNASISFDTGNQTTIVLACRAVPLGYVWDTDGSALSFSEPPKDVVPGCSPAGTLQDALVLDAVSRVDSWRVETDDLIVLMGQHDLRLARAPRRS